MIHEAFPSVESEKVDMVVIYCNSELFCELTQIHTPVSAVALR